MEMYQKDVIVIQATIFKSETNIVIRFFLRIYPFNVKKVFFSIPFDTFRFTLHEQRMLAITSLSRQISNTIFNFSKKNVFVSKIGQRSHNSKILIIFF